MVCFNHSKESSSAMCKHCHKLICKSCIIDSGWGIVCSVDCKVEVNAIEKVIAQNKLAVSSNELSKHVLIDEFERAKKNHSNFIASLVFISCIVFAIGVDRKAYDYSVTFIIILSIIILYSVFKIKSLEKALKQLKDTL